MEKYILSVLVKNNAGVLARVSSLFGRRGYNIDSLTVSATNNPAVSRITIVDVYKRQGRKDAHFDFGSHYPRAQGRTRQGI